MKLLLMIVLISLTCSAAASGKLSIRQTQIAALRAIEKVGLLEANIHLKMDNLPSRRIIRHSNVLVDVVQTALLQLELHEDLTPLEALRQQKEESGWKNNGSFLYLFSSITSKRATTVDVLMDLLKNEKKVARFIALPDDLAPPTDDLDLTSE